MKTPLSLLFASTALGIALGLPALAAGLVPSPAAGLCTADVCAAVLGLDDRPLPLIRVSGDDDDDDGWSLWRHDDDDEDDDNCGEDEDDDDEGCARTGGRGNPAPAGSVPPPANGLFGNGAPPVAVTN